MATLTKVSLIVLKLLVAACLLPLLPVVGLMWLAKWATPESRAAQDTIAEPTILAAQLEVGPSDECAWYGRVALRRVPHWEQASARAFDRATSTRGSR